jgi:hypothetical protein
LDEIVEQIYPANWAWLPKPEGQQVTLIQLKKAQSKQRIVGSVAFLQWLCEAEII